MANPGTSEINQKAISEREREREMRDVGRYVAAMTARIPASTRVISLTNVDNRLELGHLARTQ